MNPPEEHPDWQQLVKGAQQQVRETLHALPPSLRELGARLPIFYEAVPSAEIVEEGIDPDTLGLFSGATLEEEQHGEAMISGQITLYLENLWDFAEGDPGIFREEVKVTLLHELGHYLGLNEDDLIDRGLE